MPRGEKAADLEARIEEALDDGDDGDGGGDVALLPEGQPLQADTLMALVEYEAEVAAQAAQRAEALADRVAEQAQDRRVERSGRQGTGASAGEAPESSIEDEDGPLGDALEGKR